MSNDADIPAADPSEESADKRIIKRYSNRKLYDTRGSSYVTLLQIAAGAFSRPPVHVPCGP